MNAVQQLRVFGSEGFDAAVNPFGEAVFPMRFFCDGECGHVVVSFQVG